jgi:hypothetical protein
MTATLPGGIEVIESPGRVRYLLPSPGTKPSRWLGWPLLFFALIPIGLGLAFVIGASCAAGGAHTVVLLPPFVAALLFIALGSLLLFLAGFCIAGRGEIELTQDELTAVMRVGPIRWSGRRRRRRVRRLELHRSQGDGESKGILGSLMARSDRGWPLTLAWGYRPELLAPLADDLARRWAESPDAEPIEVVDATQPRSHDWRRTSVTTPVKTTGRTLFHYLFFGSFLFAGSLFFVVIAVTLARGDPEKSLQGAYPYKCLWILFPLPFIAVGAGGVLHHWRERQRVDWSPEKSAADDPSSREEKPPYPTVPQITTHRGREWEHRLEARESPAFIAGCLVVLLLVCSGVLTPSVMGVLSARRAGADMSEGLPAIAFFFTLAGGLFFLFLLLHLLYQLRLWWVGIPVVELSAHPLRPGTSSDVVFSLPGPLRLRKLDVAILCEETAIYSPHSESDSGAETRCVHREELLSRTDLRVPRGKTILVSHRFTMPLGAMHSFEATNNKVTWLVRVQGRTAGLLGVNIKQDYRLQVLPREEGTS